jgi:adenylate kinase family enzyme
MLGNAGSPQRIAILGNSGAGKSHLGERLGQAFRAPWVPLDPIFWEEADFRAPRDRQIARDIVAERAARDSWIIEGVFETLLELALPRAKKLIWLDMPWEICCAGLLARGVTEENAHRDFWLWARDYWKRTTACSFSAHERVFAAFQGEKHRIGDRGQLELLVACLKSQATDGARSAG